MGRTFFFSFLASSSAAVSSRPNDKPSAENECTLARLLVSLRPPPECASLPFSDEIDGDVVSADKHRSDEASLLVGRVEC